MKTFQKQFGPFKEQPYFSDSEIENTCSDELSRMDLLPSQPTAIRIERFIEKRFKVTPSYEDLPAGVLGMTKFTKKGVAEIIIAKFLEDEGSQTAERRIRTTLAHEAGHGLLHAYLFALESDEEPLFGDRNEPNKPKVMCRENSGQWWEFQANKAMGALLMPRKLTVEAATPFLTKAGSMGIQTIPENQRQLVERGLANTFDVNPIVAKIRLRVIFPANAHQMTL
jgi:hypothetical protein